MPTSKRQMIADISEKTEFSKWTSEFDLIVMNIGPKFPKMTEPTEIL